MTLKLTDNAPNIWGENLPYWYIVLARIGSLFLMLSGLYYWVGILGVLGESGLETEVWQEAALRVILASSFLIAAVGVWQLTFWGVVMWVLSVITQTGAIMAFENFASQQVLISAVHLLGLIALVGTSGWIYMNASKQEE
ncbi:hypothetical protein [Cohaesibacter celericrescens]|uniref:Uncharacterized protein n=1 Tax=Cohaesibacter celericrescens TaxID=2067669 RepID=A0A2N5XQF8_9HYPH|nr:hypothetical protein [Cohaesibacter celericrescens]PLW76723.1 hypothetical protein C0081_11675 [Cohaesibacter celericrescens]